MNGICIWHEAFGDKFSTVKDNYQIFKNDLILCAVDEGMQDVKMMDCIKDVFWQELFKFNYNGCELILDAVDDYLKGPEFLMTVDGSQNICEKSQKDNIMKPISKSLKRKIKFNELYNYEPLKGIKKIIYDYTCNGQKRVTFISKFRKRTVGIIPYGWGYFQKKQFLCEKLYAVDKINKTYTLYCKDTKRFNKLVNRFNDVISRYNKEHESVNRKYISAMPEMINIEFWKEYLDI